MSETQTTVQPTESKNSPAATAASLSSVPWWMREGNVEDWCQWTDAVADREVVA